MEFSDRFVSYLYVDFSAIVVETLNVLCWCFTEEGTPGLIPNPEVKLFRGDGSRKGESSWTPT